jgi:predicted DNA-binding transcriptional regulator YafY
MRADRLLTLLMLLQARGRTTAEALADELEVSVRTVYRDLTALSTSGVPVYAERGPGGGVGLVEEYRTSLTGLSPQEVSALFMVDVPGPLRQLGVGQEYRTAMLKLAAALPDSRRGEESRARQRIHLDSSWWFQDEEPLPGLERIRQAVWQDRNLRIRYLSFQNIPVEQVVEPYGLVAKASLWHLVYGFQGVLRVRPVADLLEVEILESGFTRPPDFDLPAFWEAWCAEAESRPAYRVQARVSPELLPLLPLYLAERFRRLPEATPEADGWTTLELSFESFTDARSRLLGMGRAVEVLAPEPLRRSLVDFARQIVELYRAED